jgi:hypothetical protein
MVHSSRRYKSGTACNIPLPLETRPVVQLVASLCCYSGGLGAPKSEKVSFFRLSPPETRSVLAVGAKLIASPGDRPCKCQDRDRKLPAMVCYVRLRPEGLPCPLPC